jgi:hypothetical protein
MVERFGCLGIVLITVALIFVVATLHNINLNRP